MKKIIFKMAYKMSSMLLDFVSRFNIVRVKSDLKYTQIIDNYNHPYIYSEDTFKDEQISKCSYDLSIIIPVYNSEKYLKKCLDSVINAVENTKYKVQIICVNDGSTDSSLEILKTYTKKISDFFIINQINGGISNARNNGIRASSGTYLGFIDNDDWVTSDYIEKLLNRAYSTNADIVKCNHVNYSLESECEVGVIRHDDASIKKFGLNIMEFKGYIWGGIIRRKLFDYIRFPEKYWYEDIMMRFTLMRISSDFEYIDENLYYYALHKTNASRTVWKKNNIKTLDFYYLLCDLCEINRSLKIKNDDIFYNQLLYELGPNFWLRTRKMNTKFQKNLFLYACKLHDLYKCNNCCEYFGYNKYFSDAFNTRNYLLWKTAAFHVICGIHLDYVR